MACHYVAENCDANILVVENDQQLKKILQVSGKFQYESLESWRKQPISQIQGKHFGDLS